MCPADHGRHEQLNIIIAMMSHTYDQRKQENDQIWKLEIFSRIIRFEKQFPELWGTAHKPSKVNKAAE
jgi:hypothetical protein